MDCSVDKVGFQIEVLLDFRSRFPRHLDSISTPSRYLFENQSEWNHLHFLYDYRRT